MGDIGIVRLAAAVSNQRTDVYENLKQTKIVDAAVENTAFKWRKANVPDMFFMESG